MRWIIAWFGVAILSLLLCAPSLLADTSAVAIGSNTSRLDLGFQMHIWQGYYGNISSTGAASVSIYGTETDVFPAVLAATSCNGTNIYATTLSTIDWNNVVAALPAEVDAFIGTIDYSGLSATNIFTSTVNFTVNDAGRALSAVRMNSYEGRYYVGLLKQGSTLIFVVNITSGKAFDNTSAEYQMMLPSPIGQTTTYNIFSDPACVPPAAPTPVVTPPGGGGGGIGLPKVVPAPSLTTSPLMLLIDVEEGETATLPLVMTNVGTAGAAVQLSTSLGYLDKLALSLPAGESRTVFLTVTGGAPGAYSGRITLAYNGVSKQVLIVLTVRPKAVPFTFESVTDKDAYVSEEEGKLRLLFSKVPEVKEALLSFTVYNESCHVIMQRTQNITIVNETYELQLPPEILENFGNYAIVSTISVDGYVLSASAQYSIKQSVKPKLEFPAIILKPSLEVGIVAVPVAIGAALVIFGLLFKWQAINVGRVRFMRYRFRRRKY